MGLKVLTGMEARHARNTARERLVKAGHKGALNKVESLLCAIEVELGSERNCSPEEWISKYLRLTAKPELNTVRGFRELRPRAQWDINVERARKAQPSRWTPDGIGNGAEHQHGYGRGS